jgi:gibberellin A4 carboxyl methyltransferase
LTTQHPTRFPVSFNERFSADGNLEAYARDYVNFFRAFTEAVLRNSLPATDERDRLVERIYDKAIALLKVSPDLYPFRYIAVAALMTRTGN